MPRVSEFFGIDMVRIKMVQPLDGFWVRLTLTNGNVKDVDLAPYLNGSVFKPMRDNRELFARVKVDPDLGTLVWDNGADICPDVLIQGLAPAALTVEPASVT